MAEINPPERKLAKCTYVQCNAQCGGEHVKINKRHCSKRRSSLTSKINIAKAKNDVVHHTCLEEIFGSTSKPSNDIYVELILGKNKTAAHLVLSELQVPYGNVQRQTNVLTDFSVGYRKVASSNTSCLETMETFIIAYEGDFQC